MLTLSLAKSILAKPGTAEKENVNMHSSKRNGFHLSCFFK